MVLLGTFFALCLAIWGFALSRNETTPRRAIYGVLLVLLFALLVAWSLTIVGVVASAWAVADGMDWLDALKGGFAAATVAALALLGACAVSFVLLAKWTWELNRRLDRVLPPWQGNGPLAEQRGATATRRRGRTWRACWRWCPRRCSRSRHRARSPAIAWGWTATSARTRGSRPSPPAAR